MSKFFIFILMVFCHVVDDYYLQGILASMKQRQWWVDNAPKELYQHDYKVALVMHAFSWAFMIMLPIAVHMNFQPTLRFFVALAVNMIIHAFVDDLKANKMKINLIEDQTAHIVQIVITALLLL